MSWLHWFDNTQLVGFYALSLVAIIASLRVIMIANPVHAILSMIVTLLALAGIFFILGAPFAGALQVIVYAGAILVLFVFVIMMLNLGVKNDARESRWLTSDVWAVPTGLTLIIGIVLCSMLALDSDIATLNTGSANMPAAMIGAETVSSKQVGIALFSEYLLLVEVAALLLLAALVAAYHLGKRALSDENNYENGRMKYAIKEYENDDETDAVEYAEPYQYKSIDGKAFKAAQKNNITKADLPQREDG